MSMSTLHFQRFDHALDHVVLLGACQQLPSTGSSLSGLMGATPDISIGNVTREKPISGPLQSKIAFFVAQHVIV